MTFNKDQPTYVALRSIVAERTRPLVIWCGSGLSVDAGLPSWAGLRATLTTALRQKAGTLDSAGELKLLSQADAVDRTHNNWIAFKMLKEALGETTYREAIKEALRPAPKAAIPEAYRLLWRLRPAGVLNLNLERLATRAFSEVNAAQPLAEFNSRSVAAFMHVLRSPDPYVYNLHGQTDDATSWVFTYEDLKELQENAAYRTFVTSAVTTTTVLFVGVSVDDTAVGGHLEALTRLGIDFGAHYWVTDRRDADTDRWAESAGIALVRYTSVGSDHSELRVMLEDLLTYVPPENTASQPPVRLQAAVPPQVLPDPDELLSEPADSIRLKLNREAAEILRDETADAYDSYEEFCSEYDQAIYRAWYTTAKPPHNKLLGFELNREVTQGAFGKLYEATSPSGERVAVKVLLNEVRTNHEYLQSFRRGVRSMRILSENRVSGMVPYRDASEIPAFVVMEWIEGPNLQEAVLARRIEEWADVLRVGIGIAEVIRQAHALPQRVLHRDLRPLNIMLEGVWTDDDWRVVVLDFDLSWHPGAFEKSVVHTAGTTGYLAPEQIEKIKSVSTQHSAVDSFGLGMTLYFMAARRDPLPDQHRHEGWEQGVHHATATRVCRPWNSLPARYARVVLSATRDRQAERWDVSQILGELQRLCQCVSAPKEVESADLLAEEIAARSDALQGYSWNMNTHAASVDLPSGLYVEVRANESARHVELSLRWTTRGDLDRGRLGKQIPAALEEATAALKRGLWSVTAVTHDRAWMNLGALLTVDLVRGDLDLAAQSLDKAAAAFRYLKV